jgi:hypothetical protein
MPRLRALAGILVVYVTAPSAEVADSLAIAVAAFCISSRDPIYVLPACPLVPSYHLLQAS